MAKATSKGGTCAACAISPRAKQSARETAEGENWTATTTARENDPVLRGQAISWEEYFLFFLAIQIALSRSQSVKISRILASVMLIFLANRQDRPRALQNSLHWENMAAVRLVAAFHPRNWGYYLFYTSAYKNNSHHSHIMWTHNLLFWHIAWVIFQPTRLPVSRHTQVSSPIAI